MQSITGHVLRPLPQKTVVCFCPSSGTREVTSDLVALVAMGCIQRREIINISTKVVYNVAARGMRVLYSTYGLNMDRLSISME